MGALHVKHRKKISDIKKVNITVSLHDKISRLVKKNKTDKRISLTTKGVVVVVPLPLLEL